MKIRTIPAGITWQRTGHLSSICTIRREPETVVEWEMADVLSWHQSHNAILNEAMLRGVPRLSEGGGMFGWLFGDVGLDPHKGA